MTKFSWVAKDPKDKIWLFEFKPHLNKELACWEASKGEEIFNLETYPIPLKLFSRISNSLRRTPWEKSIHKLDPYTWEFK
jgi:hypothetical protein